MTLPLDKMTLQEKFDLIDVIWADLSRYPAGIPMPAWYGDFLRERERLVREGKLRLMDLGEAERSVRDLTRKERQS